MRLVGTEGLYKTNNHKITIIISNTNTLKNYTMPYSMLSYSAIAVCGVS